MQGRTIVAEIPDVFKQYLKRRGMADEQEMKRFLYPKLAELPKPQEMLNLELAAKIVVDFMVSGKQIIIWGDYDVDGTTATSLLVNFLGEMGTEILYHIPNRLTEGYGLNSRWFIDPVNSTISTNFLLITVDCGISNGQEIEVIKQMGGTVIVTDHHSIPEQPLPACTILNPSQQTCGFHDMQLAGVGVAFYLAAGVRAEYSRRFPQKKADTINLKSYLAFVAIGTIADVVELTPTNRILVRAGFEAMKDVQFPGLRALLASCDISPDSVSSEDVGYLIGPKINAAGRLGESKIVVDLLTESDLGRANKLAKKLTDLNEKRRKVSDSNLETALASLSISLVQQYKCAIAKGDLHQGVAGIVASRLVDLFKVPAIVFAKKLQKDGTFIYVGSARSVDGLNIVDLLKKCSTMIEKFGGHAMAAGLTIAEQNINVFIEIFSDMAQKNMENRVVQPKTAYDICCSVEVAMDKDHLHYFALLEPFGPLNPQPIFKDAQALIADTRAVGRASDHLQVTIRGKKSNFKGIGFGLGERQQDIQRNPQRKLTFTPTMNRFRGNMSWQVRVIDI